MPKPVTDVEAGSPADRAGIQPGDILLSAGGHIINDVLDYKFYTYEPAVTLKLARAGQEFEIIIRKPEGMDMGLSFDSYLMDEQKRCANNCVFCFIDQLPKNMRETVYFKDDDARLSFLTGNYISMTNLSDSDAQRIIRMKVSPLNISVHTTDAKLRSLMLGHSRGGDSLKYLHQFARAGVAINAQIVVCPGLNDGDALAKTLADLSALHPAVQSVAVVPVGLTSHRQGLYPLEAMSEACARRCIKIIDNIRKSNMISIGQALCCAADEMYLKAGLEMPDEAYYEGFRQLENGVGLMRLFKLELESALALEDKLTTPAPFGVVTGMASAAFMGGIIDMIEQKCDNLQGGVYAISNNFFGESVDVSGLVVGGDIISQLEGRPLPPRLLIPESMLRHGETVFLDDVTIEQIEARLGVKVRQVPVDGGAFLDAVLEA